MIKILNIFKNAGKIQQIIKTKQYLDKDYTNGLINEDEYNEQMENLSNSISEIIGTKMPAEDFLLIVNKAEKNTKEMEVIKNLHKSGLLTEEQAKKHMMNALIKWIKPLN